MTKLDEDKKIVEALLANGDFLDDDGYPTEDALKIIELWSFDTPGWFDFIKSIWHFRDWGWKEGESIDDVTGEKGYCYYISTGGWSGNESIISAMKSNWILWSVCWVQARRGGHFIFEKRL